MENDGSERTLQDWLESAQRGVALVFVDIVGSAMLVHGKGTRVYARILSAYRQRAHQLAMQLAGRVISREGDEIFAAFLDAWSAYRFACGMFDDAGDPEIAVRVGVHLGLVSCHESRLVGRAIPVAARIMGHAGPHQVWVSDDAKKALEVESNALAKEIRWLGSEQCVLDGIPDSLVLWRAA